MLRINIHLSGILDATDFMNFRYACANISEWTWEPSQAGSEGTHELWWTEENGSHGCVCCREEQMCLGDNVSVEHQEWWTNIYNFFPDKGTWKTTSSDGKSFYSFRLSQACISSSFHDHSAHDNLANSHSTVQRQILPMICSEGPGF